MEPQKTKRYILPVIGVIVGLAVVLLIKQFFFAPESFDKAIMQVAGEINETCPIMVDSETQLNNVVALPDNSFQYNYALINYSKEELDPEVLRADLEPRIIHTIRSNPDLIAFRRNKVTMIYSYSDRNAEFLFKIRIEPEQYEE